MENFDFLDAGSEYLNRLRRTPEEVAEEVTEQVKINETLRRWREERVYRKK